MTVSRAYKQIILLSLALIAFSLVLSACVAGNEVREKQVTETGEGEYVKISAAEAKEMIDSEEVVIVDVRTREEYAEMHIEGAMLIPDYEIANSAADLLPDKDAIILVYCRSGRRSELAARILIDMGYRNVFDFGGIIDWPYEIIHGSD